jgi:molybdopterin-guanine dinucleotide biosynthesis protein A
MNVTGVILAGGKSSRMGQDKGLLLLNNQPLVKHVIQTLKPITNQIIIISNNDDYKIFGYPVFGDIFKGKGPVGGIHTALTHSQTKKNIIISCDTPFVSVELLTYLLKQSIKFQVTVAEFNNKIHPLIGVYHQSIKSTFKSNLDKNQLKLMLVNQSLNCNIVKMDGKFNDKKLFYNINTPSDLKQAQNEY